MTELATRRPSVRLGRIATAEVLAVAAILVATVVVRVPTLGQPLTEKHGWRQTQTAYTALLYHEHGIDLFDPKLPVLGEPFEVPFEFPLFQAAGALVMDAGVPPDRAMRITGLTFFIVTALLLYGLVRFVTSRFAALATLVAFVASPFGLVWSRTSMIEYMATAGAVGWVWGGIAWRERPDSWRRYGLALVAGTVGMMVKITTAAFWILPLLLYRPRRATRSSWRAHAALTVLVVVPTALALAWTHHADDVKAASPWTAAETSSALRHFNFGTLHQRLELTTYKVIGKLVLQLVTGWPSALLLVAAALALLRSRDRLLWIGVALCAALPPLVFTNLYYVHDYYLAALTPALAALLGLGAAWLWERRRPRAGLPLAIAAGVLLVAVGLLTTRSYWTPIYEGTQDADHVLAMASELRSASRPQELVAFDGYGWSPAIFYYARRTGQMMPEEINSPPLWRVLRREDYHVYGMNAPAHVPPALAVWQWVTSLGLYSYRAGASRSSLGPATFVAGPEIPPGLHLTTLRAQPLTIPCGRGTTLPARRGSTWLSLAPAPSGALLILVRDERSIPARRAVGIVGRASTPLRVDCRGARRLIVERVAGTRSA